MKFGKYIYKKDFEFKEDRIFLTEEGRKRVPKLKKITGSRIAAVLGLNNHMSAFQAWCDIFGFYKSDVEEFFVEAGKVIEPKIKRYIESRLNKKLKDYDPKSIGFDLFKEESKIFGGIPDGEEYSEDGKILSILEIKTASIDKYKWEKCENELKLQKENGIPILSKKGAGLTKWFLEQKINIPLQYQYQLALYLYLRNINKGYFCISFLNHEDYLDPEKVFFSSSNKDLKIKELDINNEENFLEEFKNEKVMILQSLELDNKKFESVIKWVEKWHKDFILSGKSPKMTTQDLQWFRYGYPSI